MPQKRSGSRLLLEGVVILVSILLALLLEGWRDDAELRRDTERQLASVRTELQRNQELLDTHLRAVDRVVEAGRALASAMSSASGQQTVEVPDTLLFAATQSFTFNASLGAIEALLSSGLLAQVEDPELRQGLAGLRDHIADASEEEAIARHINVNQLGPLMYPRVRGSLSHIRALFGAAEGGTAQERFGNSVLPSRGAVQVPTQIEVRVALGSHYNWLIASRVELGQVRLQLNYLVERIAVELQ